MTSSNEEQLGKRLQHARQAAGMTQQMLCQKASLSYSTLAKIERGAIKTPSIFTIQSIAAALGVGLDQLMGTPKLPVHEWERSRSGVRFVYFDVNNCLVRFFHRAFTRIASVSDMPSDVVETLFWHYNDQICRGEMTFDEFNTTIGKQLHIVNFDWRGHYLETTETMPHMHELLLWARQHYGIGLLTNSMPGLIQQMQECGLLPRIQYDAVVDSSEVHLLKPEREIFEIAQKRAGCRPEEIFFTDDTRPNILAAQKFGWHVMWFDDSRPSESVVRLRKALELA
jgi:HAD superfamily hydrolase (TIGR01509 family)